MFQLTDIHCKNCWNPYPLGGGVHHYHFLSPPAKMIQFDLRNIFRLGWQKSHGKLTFSWLENPPCESMYLQKNAKNVYFPTTNQVLYFWKNSQNASILPLRHGGGYAGVGASSCWHWTQQFGLGRVLWTCPVAQARWDLGAGAVAK